jgi:hypothetical protein
MPVTADRSGPYAPPSAILEVINRRRDRGLTAPINADVLARAGISSSLIPRTLQSLETLDLIDASGQPTATFEALRLAPTSEFQTRLQEWLKSAYADVFAFVDPSQDDEIKITDAFRNYEPAGMQRRMVILFRELCKAAGLAPQKQSAAQKSQTTRPSRPAFSPQMRAAAKRIVVERFKMPPAVNAPSGIPAPIAGLLASLPKEGTGWTQPRRDSFVATFNAVLDFCFPILAHDPDDNDADQADAPDDTVEAPMKRRRVV